MKDEIKQDPAFGLEQTMSTVFACRSVVKYNTALSEEQRSELISEIDISLRFLRESLIADASGQLKLSRTQFQPAFVAAPPVEKPDMSKDKHLALRELYRIYHAYIDTKQSLNISTFVVRFDAVVAALNDIQQLIERDQNVCMHPTEDPLHRVRAFIADLYYMFMELVRALSNALEGNDVHIDTEEHSSMSGVASAGEEQSAFSLHYLVPLAKVFAEHRRFNETKETFTNRIDDTLAFLIYLEETLTEGLYKRSEIISHLYKASILLGDLSYLVSSYENIVGLVLNAG